MFSPKILKYKKHFKLRKFKGMTKDSGLVTIGDFALKATEGCLFTAKQMETIRMNILKKLREFDKNTQIFMKTFGHIPVSKKPAEVRMGGGKGAVEFYACKVLPGKVILEVVCKTEKENIIAVLLSASNKLPFKTVVVERWI